MRDLKILIKLNKLKNKSAFSLMEVMIALSLFALASIVYLNTQTTAIKQSQNSEDLSKVLFLAQSKMTEQILEFKKKSKTTDMKSMNERLEGEFEEAPLYKWVVEIKDFDFMIPQALLNDPNADDQSQGINQLIFESIKKNISDNIKELSVTVKWFQEEGVFSQKKVNQKESTNQYYKLTTYISATQPKFELQNAPSL